MPKFRTQREMRRIQLQGLQWTVNHVYQNSDHYRKRFDEMGVKPKHIKSLKDISKLPFTTAKDLQEGYPFPLRSVPFEKIVRIHASSGTTGKRKVMCYTKRDVDDWAHLFARCFEMEGVDRQDRIQVAVGYGVWTAGVGFQRAIEEIGAMAIPSGPGNIDMQCQFLEDFQTTFFCGTASMSLLMAEEIERRGMKDRIALRKWILGSERSSETMRRRVQDLTGVEHVFDVTGLTELYGPGMGTDCLKHEGIHFWADYYIVEFLDPETLQPVEPGEIGEMVVTTLRKEATPLIRYRTRDLTRLIPERCSCGSILPLHDRILGRSDDMFIFRAVNIYPGQIDHILSNTRNIGSEYQIHLDRKEDGKDYMTVKVERAEGVYPSEDPILTRSVEEEIKIQILVSAGVEIVDYGSLPRTERKSKRVFDNREE